jgi:hypothetical protein
MKLSNKILFGIPAAALILYFVFVSLSQPGPADLKGNMKEVAMDRNENNTGPVQRVYVVSIEDTLWQQMKQYGRFMPHTKYGSTRVFFFRKGEAPEAVDVKQLFADEYKDHCLARYEKNNMGAERLTKYPFSSNPG